MYGNHFKFAELIHTDTGLDNTPLTDSHLGNLATLWNTLNFFREELGEPIFVNSAYRTPSVNKQVSQEQNVRSIYKAERRFVPCHDMDKLVVIEQ